MAALRRLRALNRWDVFLPGHGAEIVFPARRLDDLIAHRTGRETAILTALGIEAQTGDQLTHRLYTDTPSPLIPAARRNVLAHLIALWESGHVICDAPLREHSLFALGPKAD
jgi:glyoxylase-like metal-dependent hydrolase (beta-lactamase superfamily II)